MKAFAVLFVAILHVAVTSGQARLGTTNDIIRPTLDRDPNAVSSAASGSDPSVAMFVQQVLQGLQGQITGQPATQRLVAQPAAAQLNTQSGAQFNTQPGAQFYAQPGDQFNAQPGAQFNAQPGAQFITQPGAQFNTQPGAQFNTQPGAQFNAQPGAQFNTQSGSQFNTQPGAQFNGQLLAQPGAQRMAAQPGTQYHRPGANPVYFDNQQGQAGFSSGWYFV